MEGVLITLISGLFGLAGIWLGHYLKERKSDRPAPQPDEPIQKKTTNVTQPKQKASPSGPSQNEQREGLALFKMPSWWIVVAFIIISSIGAAFFAQWIINYGLGVFKVATPEVEFSWLALGLGGLVWGIVYVIAGTSDADNVVDCLFGLFIPYEDLFSPFDLGDFVRALLSALPINFLISWGAAISFGFVAESHFNADLSGVVYLVFSGVVFFSIAWFLSEG